MSDHQQMDPRMQQFLEEEKRKAVFNEVVAQLANVCFEKWSRKEHQQRY